MRVTIDNLKKIKPNSHYAVFLSNKMVDTIMKSSVTGRVYDIVVDSWSLEEYASHAKNMKMFPLELIKPPKVC